MQQPHSSKSPTSSGSAPVKHAVLASDADPTRFATYDRSIFIKLQTLLRSDMATKSKVSIVFSIMERDQIARSTDPTVLLHGIYLARYAKFCILKELNESAPANSLILTAEDIMTTVLFGENILRNLKDRLLNLGRASDIELRAGAFANGIGVTAAMAAEEPKILEYPGIEYVPNVLDWLERDDKIQEMIANHVMHRFPRLHIEALTMLRNRLRPAARPGQKRALSALSSAEDSPRPVGQRLRGASPAPSTSRGTAAPMAARYSCGASPAPSTSRVTAAPMAARYSRGALHGPMAARHSHGALPATTGLTSTEVTAMARRRREMSAQPEVRPPSSVPTPRVAALAPTASVPTPRVAAQAPTASVPTPRVAAQAPTASVPTPRVAAQAPPSGPRTEASRIIPSGRAPPARRAPSPPEVADEGPRARPTTAMARLQRTTQLPGPELECYMAVVGPPKLHPSTFVIQPGVYKLPLPPVPTRPFVPIESERFPLDLVVLTTYFRYPPMDGEIHVHHELMEFIGVTLPKGTHASGLEAVKGEYAARFNEPWRKAPMHMNSLEGQIHTHFKPVNTNSMSDWLQERANHFLVPPVPYHSFTATETIVLAMLKGFKPFEAVRIGRAIGFVKTLTAPEKARLLSSVAGGPKMREAMLTLQEHYDQVDWANVADNRAFVFAQQGNGPKYPAVLFKVKGVKVGYARVRVPFVDEYGCMGVKDGETIPPDKYAEHLLGPSEFWIIDRIIAVVGGGADRIVLNFMEFDVPTLALPPGLGPHDKATVFYRARMCNLENRLANEQSINEYLRSRQAGAPPPAQPAAATAASAAAFVRAARPAPPRRQRRVCDQDSLSGNEGDCSGMESSSSAPPSRSSAPRSSSTPPSRSSAPRSSSTPPSRSRPGLRRRCKDNGSLDAKKLELRRRLFEAFSARMENPRAYWPFDEWHPLLYPGDQEIKDLYAFLIAFVDQVFLLRDGKVDVDPTDAPLPQLPAWCMGRPYNIDEDRRLNLYTLGVDEPCGPDPTPADIDRVIAKADASMRPRVDGLTPMKLYVGGLYTLEAHPGAKFPFWCFQAQLPWFVTQVNRPHLNDNEKAFNALMNDRTSRFTWLLRVTLRLRQCMSPAIKVKKPTEGSLLLTAMDWSTLSELRMDKITDDELFQLVEDLVPTHPTLNGALERVVRGDERQGNHLLVRLPTKALKDPDNKLGDMVVFPRGMYVASFMGRLTRDLDGDSNAIRLTFPKRPIHIEPEDDFVHDNELHFSPGHVQPGAGGFAYMSGSCCLMDDAIAEATHPISVAIPNTPKTRAALRAVGGFGCPEQLLVMHNLWKLDMLQDITTYGTATFCDHKAHKVGFYVEWPYAEDHSKPYKKLQDARKVIGKRHPRSPGQIWKHCYAEACCRWLVRSKRGAVCLWDPQLITSWVEGDLLAPVKGLHRPQTKGGPGFSNVAARQSSRSGARP